jgi:hypothetical protein
MGYFSNGTEGEDYQQEYCVRCQHFNDCAVWDAHLLHNYDECNKRDSILHDLIPRGERGMNGKCRMFLAKGQPLRFVHGYY